MNTELWIAFLGMLIPLTALFGAGFAFMYREQKEWRIEAKADFQKIADSIKADSKADTQKIVESINKETESIRKETESIREETKQRAAQADRLFEQQTARSDKLYQMFIDLLQDKRKHITDPRV